jgi:penicillin-binding protein 1A
VAKLGGLVAVAGGAWLAVWCAGVSGDAAVVVGLALAVAYPNLPEISSLTDYRPKLPLRVYSADGVQIGEFGEERRTFVPIARFRRS